MVDLFGKAKVWWGPMGHVWLFAVPKSPLGFVQEWASDYKKNRQTKTSGETPEYMVPMPGILGRANQGLVLLTALVLEMQFHPYKDNRPMVEIAELFSTGARLAIRKMDSRTFQVSELLHTHIDR